MIEPIRQTDVWATYSDPFYKGKAAVLHRKLGKGTITYVGADTDNGQLEKTVLQKSSIRQTYQHSICQKEYWSNTAMASGMDLIILLKIRKFRFLIMQKYF